MMRTFVQVGALFGFLSVAAGAFGAHALRGRLEPRAVELFETAARYQMFHALALVLVGGLLARVGEGTFGLRASSLTVAGGAFVVGTLIFCGTVYALALGAPRVLGAVTPIGGVAFLIGWGALVHSAL